MWLGSRVWWGVQGSYGVFLVDGDNGVQIAFLLAAWFVPGRVVHLAAADLECALIEGVGACGAYAVCDRRKRVDRETAASSTANKP